MRRIWVVVVILVLVALLFPVHTRCGAANYACAIPPDDSGRVGYYYEIEPLGITLLENVAGRNFRMFYSSGTERVE